MINKTSFYLGMCATGAESGIPPEELKRKTRIAKQAKTHPERPVLLRKRADVLARILGDHESTRNGFSHNVYRILGQQEEWGPEHEDLLKEATLCLSGHPGRNPEFEKRAGPGGDGVFAAAEALPDIGVALAGLGLLGGGAWHFMNKSVDSDKVDIEKQKAIYNEYERLANELDRKTRYRLLKERQNGNGKDGENN